MCQPMRTNGRITRSKSYKIHVSLSEGWCGDGARIVSGRLDGGDGVGESDIYSELE